MKSLIQIRNELLKEGIEVLHHDNKAIVFKNGEFYREGKIKYANWELAITETERIFYENLKIIK